MAKFSVVANFATLQIEGNREVLRSIEYYNLDVILSVGYLINIFTNTNTMQKVIGLKKQHIEAMQRYLATLKKEHLNITNKNNLKICLTHF